MFSRSIKATDFVRSSPYGTWITLYWVDIVSNADDLEKRTEFAQVWSTTYKIVFGGVIPKSKQCYGRRFDLITSTSTQRRILSR